MWSFRTIKEKARFSLMPNYSKCILVILICNLISNLPTLLVPMRSGINGGTVTEAQFLEIRQAVANNLGLVIGITTMIFIVSLLFSALIFTPVSVGQVRFFNRTAKGESKIKELFFAFAGGVKLYFNIVKVTFIKSLIIALWILPGVLLMAVWGFIVMNYNVNIAAASLAGTLIIMLTFILVLRKSLQYFFVEYILAEKSEVSWKQAAKRSTMMTKGRKISILALQFSFIGWYILGLAFGGIGMIFVAPYVQMTFSEFYFTIKEAPEGNLQENAQNDVKNA